MQSFVFSYIYIFAKHHFFGSVHLHYFADIPSFPDDLFVLRALIGMPYTSHLNEK